MQWITCIIWKLNSNKTITSKRNYENHNHLYFCACSGQYKSNSSKCNKGSVRSSKMPALRVVLEATDKTNVLKTYYGTISFCYASSLNDSCQVSSKLHTVYRSLNKVNLFKVHHIFHSFNNLIWFSTYNLIYLQFNSIYSNIWFP